jgi:acetate kinase
MNVLIFITRGPLLHFTGFQMPRGEPVFGGRIGHWEDSDLPVADRLRRLPQQVQDFVPDVLAVRLPYGGDVLHGPTVATPEVLARLREIIGEAPLHLPHLLRLVEGASQAFPATPLVLLAETAFFADLPAREATYGLNPDLIHSLQLRRYGFHGLYHEAAAAHLAVSRRQQGQNGPLRLLSICMEPRPEVAAIIDHRPVMVTGGTAPLEGIPGQTTCGEIDPSIVLTLAQKLNWGPEQINNLLTTQSGLLGLVGRPTSWVEVFAAADPDLVRARSVIEHHFLRACGAGMAAMGGLDALVFSGRNFGTGRHLGPWLLHQLSFKQPPDLTWECFEQPLERILCDAAVAAKDLPTETSQAILVEESGKDV